MSAEDTVAAFYHQHLPVQTLHWSECAKNISIFREANVCSRSIGATGACSGDSGGPLACPLDDRYLVKTAYFEYCEKKFVVYAYSI